MIGQTISHYKIIEKLGEGGMGVVYEAEDTKLKRTVALKFLTRGLEAHEPERARFLQEAQAASALNHPNICAIHTLGEHEDQQFIDMEYVDGKTLRQLIPIQKIEDAITDAIQIGEALEEAHSHGIVHRDVKPENIMVTGKNQIKVMDFGLAKLKGSLKLTKTSSTVGTLAYMAPEQIQGGEVDARSDIFSFGIVLFEMLTGSLPFRGEHEAAILYSIVNEESQPISLYRSDVPLHLSEIISKALQKDPASRYSGAQEIVEALKKIPSRLPVSKKREKSIVVLPFENLSPDPDQEYFSDGLTEEVISDLSAVRSLRVISRSSAMTFKGSRKTIPEIARQLNVQYVPEGSVRKAANNLRITAQLIDAANDAHVWADKYTGTLEDVFDVQEKVSRSIVAALKLKLTPEESQKIAERPIVNVAAYQCYLRASAEIWRATKSSLDSARTHLQHGLDILGDNALLYATLGMVHFQYANIGSGHEDVIATAEEYIRKALALDPDTPKAHTTLAMMAGSFYGDVRGSFRHLKLALAADPNDVEALKVLAMFYIVACGKQAAAVPLMEHVKQLDPLDWWNGLLQGCYYLYGGPYDRAIEPLRDALQLDPDNTFVACVYTLALMQAGSKEAAFRIVDQSTAVAPDTVTTKFGILMKYGLLSDREAAFREMTADFQKTCRRDFEWSYHVAVPLALLDARQESLDWLENSVNKGFINYPELARNPYLDNLRAEERFKVLIERVKKEWDQFEA